MPFSKLTFLNAVGLPLLLGVGACFLSTEAERYSDTATYGTGGGGGACEIGAPGCPCTGQGSCDPGLDCQAMLNTCVLPDGCPTGDAGCECTDGGACNEGYICKQDYCVSEAPCLPEDIGTESCQCTQGGGCDQGLVCASGICVDIPDDTTTSTTGVDPTSPSTTANHSTTDPQGTTTATTGVADESTSGPADDTTSAGSADSSTGVADGSGTAG